MNPTPDLLATLHGVCPLPQLGVIEALGDDAANFLHNQLSNDVLLLPLGHARLAAFCSAKGRMQASFVVVKTAADRVLLVMPQDLLATTLKRLSMFVMRAKVKMSDATGQWQLRGLLGDSARAVLGDGPPWQTAPVGGGLAVALYPAAWGEQRQVRAFWLAPVGDAPPPGPDIDPALWAWASVLSGVPFVTQALFEAFVPQMLNYESVGGVNFKKGCYPGQEVVARSQFRGSLKRRMARVFSSVALTPGQDVYTPSEADQPCATVVQAAARPDGSGWDALVSGTTTSMALGWCLGSAQGQALVLLDLPYALLEDV